MAALYDHIRAGPVVKREVPVATGEIDPAFADAARVVEAEYEWPFQSHASMGPACAVVDARADGATLWTGSQKPHFARDGVARILGLPPDKVHGIWVPGPGSYGRNDAGDAGIDAALLSKAVGRPVRVQGMRYEGHGWDPKGPASIHHARAALDKNGAVIGYVFESKGFSRIDIDTNESDPAYSFAGQLTGLPLMSLQGFGVPAESYGFANKRLAWETVAPLLDRPRHCAPRICATRSARRSSSPANPLSTRSPPRQAPTRSPSACVILKEPRDIAVVKAAGERAGWQPRPSPRPDRTGDMLTGRGIAYAQRSGAVVAIVAEAEIDRRTGKIWAKKFTVAHDCGLIINPDGLRRCIEGNVVQGTRRALSEEVAFDRAKVTSTDWLSYSIHDIIEAPETVDIVLINRPDLPPAGASESSIRPVAAPLANAVFDATGVRLRRSPLTPQRLKPALA
jgi:nicotinate dehydrogenase subunit B